MPPPAQHMPHASNEIKHPHQFVAEARLAQVAVVAVFVATLFIRPTMPRNNLSDANKYAGMIFFSLLNMFFDGACQRYAADGRAC